MSVWAMAVREIAYRRLNFLLAWLSVAGAAALLVGVLASLSAHEARSRRIVAAKRAETQRAMAALQRDVSRAMKRLGYNAVILPEGQTLGDWYADDYAKKTMPASWAARLDNTRGLVDRYLPQLRRKLKWPERQWTVIIVGVGQERVLDTSVCEAGPLVEPLPPGQCAVGFELQRGLGLQPGQEIVIQGRRRRVARCEPERGTKDDITIWLDLADAQQLTGQADRINEILIVEHLDVWGRTDEVRRRVAALLPGCQVVEMKSETLARAHARVKVAEEAEEAIRQEQQKQAALQAERARVLGVLLPLGVVACGAWVGVLMYVNVRDRAPELGLLMAVGYRTQQVRGLVFAKAVVLGLTGAAAGWAVGLGFAAATVGGADGVAGGAAAGQLGLALGAGAAACCLGAWWPARAAVRTDPADVLREE